MPLPIANFGFVRNINSVTFTDSSTENPTAWQWEFGFGDLISNLQHPVIVFPETSGIYLVKLQVSNGTGSNTTQQHIPIWNQPEMVSSIRQLIALELVEGVELSEEFIASKIEYWQVILRYGPYPNIPAQSINLEGFWPPLYKTLFAKLVVYEYYFKLAKSALSGTVSSSGQGSGKLKMMETGPSKVEWYDTSSTLSTIFKPGATGASLFDTLAADICQLGSFLKVKLPVCKEYMLIGNLLKAKPRK